MIPPQIGANARWWALRWYKKASLEERAAMRQLLDECGIGAAQVTMDFERKEPTDGTQEIDC